MDFIIGLPKSKENNFIMVVVNRLTKYALFFSLSHPFKASILATTFMETIYKIHGILNIIVSDRDPISTSNFWIELFSYLGTQLAHNSSYHPQSHGKTKIKNKCVEGYHVPSITSPLIGKDKVQVVENHIEHDKRFSNY
jgi:hypothetical protein